MHKETQGMHALLDLILIKHNPNLSYRLKNHFNFFIVIERLISYLLPAKRQEKMRIVIQSPGLAVCIGEVMYG